jgi:hypothetical protein
MCSYRSSLPLSGCWTVNEPRRNDAMLDVTLTSVVALELWNRDGWWTVVELCLFVSVSDMLCRWFVNWLVFHSFGRVYRILLSFVMSCMLHPACDRVAVPCFIQLQRFPQERSKSRWVVHSIAERKVCRPENGVFGVFHATALFRLFCIRVCKDGYQVSRPSCSLMRFYCGILAKYRYASCITWWQTWQTSVYDVCVDHVCCCCLPPSDWDEAPPSFLGIRLEGAGAVVDGG